MSARGPSGGIDELELPLPSNSLRTRDHLAHAADGKAHQRVAGRRYGRREQVRGHRFQVATGGMRLSRLRPGRLRLRLRFVGAHVEDPFRRRTQIEAEGQAPEPQAEAVDLDAAE